MNRYTFVIQIHPDGLSTLENLSTHERVRISELSAVGPQIEQWLATLGEHGVPSGPRRLDGDGAPIRRERAEGIEHESE